MSKKYIKNLARGTAMFMAVTWTLTVSQLRVSTTSWKSKLPASQSPMKALHQNVKIIPQRATTSTPKDHVKLSSRGKEQEGSASKSIRTMAVLTAYCNCKKCTGSGRGYTKSGVKASMRTIAAPSNIPFGAVVEIPGWGKRTVEDRGGAIKYNKGIPTFDVWFPSHEEALDFGRKRMEVVIWLK